LSGKCDSALISPLVVESATPRSETRIDAREPARVSTLELFFDLVFVFTITQLTSVLIHEPNLKGLLQAVLMLGVIWWMYSGYAWLTNEVAPDSIARRLLLLGGMGAFLIVALAIPTAFRGSGATFGLAYLLVVAVHTGTFTRTTSSDVIRGVIRLSPYNAATALLILAGGIAGGTAQYVLWTLAFLLEWATPRLISNATDFRVSAEHFVERHGLVVIIVIGESVVAVGIGAAGLPVDVDLVWSALVGLALSACLWWSYFGGAEERATDAMRATDPSRQGWVGVQAFGYWHLLILLGVIAIAAALKQSIGHPFADLTVAEALMLGGGAAAFLVGEALYRRTLGIGGGRVRVIAAVAALATIPLGTAVAVTAQLAALVAVFVVMLLDEGRSVDAKYDLTDI
jgi:low temperature requirement protein LtrA